MNFNIAIGSVLGASEYVAEACQAMLEEQGHTAVCHFTPNTDDFDLAEPLIIVTSTHGAGELPENIQPFAKSLASQNLANLNTLIIGLGDSSYDTFCEGSRTIEDTIKNAGGSVKAPVFQIDVLHHPIPEETAVEWLKQHYQTLLAS